MVSVREAVDDQNGKKRKNSPDLQLRGVSVVLVALCPGDLRSFSMN